MSFQSTVYLQQGFGVPGDLYAADAPYRAQSYILDSADAAYNKIGATCYTIISEGVAEAGNPDADAVFAGLLVNPKVYASYGASGSGPLSATETLANNTQAEIATMGSFVVTLPAAANIGDLVVFDNTTGAISTIAPGDDLPADTSFAFAFVDYRTVTAAGLGVITLDPTLVIPQPAPAPLKKSNENLGVE